MKRFFNNTELLLRKQISIEKFLLIAILFTGVCIRFFRSTLNDFSNDEAFEFFLAKMKTVDMINALIYDTHPPLHYLITKISESFGNSIFVLRFSSIIFAAVSIYIVYLIGKKLYSLKAGLISALCMSVIFRMLFYDTMARNYVLLVMLSLLSVYLYLIITQEKKKLYPLLATVLILSLYNSYLSLFTMLIMFLHYVFFYKKNLKMLFFIFPPFICYIPWLPFIYRQYSNLVLNGQYQNWNYRSDFFKEVPGYFSYAFSFDRNAFAIINTNFVINYLIGLIFLAFCITGLYFLLKKSKVSGILIALAAFFPFLFFCILSFLRSGTFITERYLLPAFPFIYILFSIFIDKIFSLKKLKYIGISILIILILFNLFQFYIYNKDAYFRLNNMKNVSDLISEHASSGDYIIFPNTDAVNLFNFYYARNDFYWKLIDKDNKKYIEFMFNDAYRKMKYPGQWLYNKIFQEKLKDIDFDFLYYVCYDPSLNDKKNTKDINEFLKNNFVIMETFISQTCYPSNTILLCKLRKKAEVK